MTNQQIQNMFMYRKPFGDQPERYAQIRADAKVLALTIQECCPESREKSVALTNLQQAVMWANASIAVRNGNEVNCEKYAELEGDEASRCCDMKLTICQADGNAMSMESMACAESRKHCKTFIRRFDSDPRLQFLPLRHRIDTAHSRSLPDGSSGPRKRCASARRAQRRAMGGPERTGAKNALSYSTPARYFTSFPAPARSRPDREPRRAPEP